MIRNDDDSFHPRTSHPRWNESSWFSLFAPDRAMGGMFYQWYRPNQNYVCAGPILWDPSGDTPYDCLWWDYNWQMAMPEGCDVLDVAFPNGASIETIKRMEEFRLRYEHPDCQIDVTWKAIGEPREMILGEMDEMREAGHGHFDQPGRVSGWANVYGDKIKIDAWAMRDRSWGPRDFSKMSTRCDYLWCVNSPDNWFLAATIEDGEDDKILAGHYVKDGVYGRLVGGRRGTTRRNGVRPVDIVVKGEDNLGRTFTAEAHATSTILMHGHAEILYFQTLAEWNFDGRTDGHGDIAETFQTKAMRKRIRAIEGRPLFGADPRTNKRT